MRASGEDIIMGPAVVSPFTGTVTYEYINMHTHSIMNLIRMTQALKCIHFVDLLYSQGMYRDVVIEV